MNGAGIMMFSFISFTAIVMLIAFITLLIKSKNNRKYKKTAWIALISYIVFITIILIVPNIWFLNIPSLKVKDNSVTILNSGTGSMGSRAMYDYSDDGIIKEISQPKYNYYMDMKFGYTFESISPGEINLMVTEIDCGDIAYADVYRVKVYDDLSLEVSHIENIDVYSKMTNREFMDYVSEKYDISKSTLVEKYDKY